MRKILCLVFLFLSLCPLCHPIPGESAELPDQAQLSAERMRFDSKTGDFLAEGNVIIHADGLDVRAPRGTGNAVRKEVHFADGITASGDWQGEWVDLTAGSVSLFFAQTPTWIVENGVKGDVGKIGIDADKLYMKGEDISALKVRRLEDREAGIAFGADDIRGTMVNGVLTSLVAKTGVWLEGRPDRGGEPADIRGDTAVWSAERGSVVISGNVRAVQGGRNLTAQSVVYFPATNRVEAIGGLVKSGDAVTPGRSTITIDLGRERQR